MGLIIVMMSVPWGGVYFSQEDCEGVTNAYEVFRNHLFDECFDTGESGTEQYQRRTCDPGGNVTTYSYGNDSTCTNLLNTEVNFFADDMCHRTDEGGVVRWYRGSCTAPANPPAYEDYAHVQKHIGPTDCEGLLFVDYYLRPTVCGLPAMLGTNSTMTCIGTTIKIYNYTDSKCLDDKQLYVEDHIGQCALDGQSYLISCPEVTPPPKKKNHVALIVGLAVGIPCGLCLICCVCCCIGGVVCRLGFCDECCKKLLRKKTRGFQEI